MTTTAGSIVRPAFRATEKPCKLSNEQVADEIHRITRMMRKPLVRLSRDDWEASCAAVEAEFCRRAKVRFGPSFTWAELRDTTSRGEKGGMDDAPYGGCRPLVDTRYDFLWRWDRPVGLLVQPLASEVDVAEAVRVYADMGLKVRFPEFPSWACPGRTILAAIVPADGPHFSMNLS